MPRFGVGVFILGLVLAGCGADSSDQALEAKRHVGIYKASSPGGDTALLGGVVRLVDGCFLVEDINFGMRYLPYFPDDEVEWTDGALRYNDKTYSDGDPISLGGGERSDSPDELPAECRQLNINNLWSVATR